MFGRIKQIAWGALLGCLIATQALGQATLLPNAKQQFFTPQGIPAAAGTVDMYVPSTTTRKTTWKSSSETVGNQNTNPILLDAGGFAQIYGDGQYRQIVKDADGNTIWDAITASTGSGGGGGGTTVGDGNIVGTILPWVGLVAPPNYLFAAGQAISRTTYPLFFTTTTIAVNIICTSGLNVLSGISDTQNIKINAQVEASCIPPGTRVTAVAANAVTVTANATVSTAVSARFFPWGNGDGSTTFSVPDLRGYTIAGRNNMNGSAGTALTAPFCGTSPNAMGAPCGSQSQTLSAPNLPAYTPAGTIVNGAITSTFTGTTNQQALGPGGGTEAWAGAGSLGHTVPTGTVASTQATSTFTGTAAAGQISAPFSIVQPTATLNYIVKVLPDASTTVASGVASLGGMTGVIACGTGLTCGSQTISFGGGNVATVSLPVVSGNFPTFSGTGGLLVDSGIPSTVYAAFSGVKCDTTTDDTIALNSFLAMVASGHINGILPNGTCKFTGPLTVPPTLNDWSVTGQGPATKLLYSGASTTATLLTIGDGTNSVLRYALRNFTIDTSTTMTAGTALRARKSGTVVVDGVWVGCTSADRIWNGVWFDGLITGSYINSPCNVAKNESLIFNTGSELNIDNSTFFSSANVGVHMAGGFGGVYLGYVSFFGQTVGFLADNAIDATGNNQIFVSNRTAFDNNPTAGIKLNDSVSSFKSLSWLGWCASSNASAGCMDITAFANGNVQIGGGAQFLSNVAAGIVNRDATVRLAIDPAAYFGNTTFGVNCTVATTKVFGSQTIGTNGSGNYSSNCGVPTLTANALMVGGGTSNPDVVASLGTTTTVLHGNAAGKPTFGQVANADMVNTATTVNGQTCTLGSACTVTASSTSATVGTTSILSGTSHGVLTNNAGVLGNTAAGTSGQVFLGVTASEPNWGTMSGSATITNAGVVSLSSVISAGGPTGSATVAPIITYNAEGRLTTVSSATITPAVGSITGLGTGVATWLATPSSANLAAVVTDETGSGALVFGTSPTLATPVINGLPTGTGVATANTVSTLVARDGSGNFSAGTITAALSGNATTATSATSATTATTATNATNTAITDDTTTNATMLLTWVTANTGNLPQKVTSTKLTFNPSTGALSSTSFTGAGTGLTGTAASLTAGTVTTNANLTGPITSSGNATSIASQTGTGTKFVVDTNPSINGSLGVTDGSTYGFIVQSGGSLNVAIGGTTGTQTMGLFSNGTLGAQLKTGFSIGTTTDPGAGSLQVNATIIAPNLTSDAGLADTTLCWKNAATTGTFLKGSGTLGICLGTSGAQFKTAFAPMVGGLEEVMGLNLQNYRYRNGYGDSGERMQYGLTAQDVDKIMPDLVRRDSSGEVVNYDAGAFLFIGLRAIQQLKADNDNIEMRLAKMESRK